MGKKVLKFENDIETGTIGELTPIKDKNGTTLRVGDLVLVKLENTYHISIIVKIKNKYNAFGAGCYFDDNGIYNTIELTKLFDCENFKSKEIISLDLFNSFDICEAADA